MTDHSSGNTSHRNSFADTPFEACRDGSKTDDEAGRGVMTERETTQASMLPGAMLPEDELRLIDAARKQPESFEPLYRHYAPMIYRFCYRQLGHREAAADVTSQTFIKAIAALRTFRPDPKYPGRTFRAWLFRIAGNVVIDHRRAHRNHRSLDAPDQDAALTRFLVDPGRSPEELALASSEASAVRAALEYLPDRQRGIVELRLVGLTGEEIAEAMNMTLSAVKSAQFRAYGTLREALLPHIDRGPSR
jgi:RNA polymerase sigma-70 factor (ECF subfamily)